MVVSATTQNKKKTKYVGFENEKKDTQQCRQLQENSFDVFNSFNFYVLLLMHSIPNKMVVIAIRKSRAEIELI
jgi:hypothetical protein